MSRRIAHCISWLFNPGCLVLVLLLLGLVASPFSVRAEWGWLLALSLFVLVGSVILLVSWAHGVQIDVDLITPFNLADRSRILVIFLSLILVMLGVSFQMHQLQPFHAILATILTLGVAVTLITLLWKISLHMVGVAMLVTATILMNGSAWWPMIGFFPIVAWARLRLVRHTPLQLLAGTVIGFFLTSLVFWLYHLV